jgi:hypothetical protein
VARGLNGPVCLNGGRQQPHPPGDVLPRRASVSWVSWRSWGVRVARRSGRPAPCPGKRAAGPPGADAASGPCRGEASPEPKSVIHNKTMIF